MIYAMTNQMFFHLTHKWQGKQRGYVKYQDKAGVIADMNGSGKYLGEITDIRVKGEKNA